MRTLYRLPLSAAVLAMALAPVLKKLNLDFERYINVHTSPMPQTKADFWKAVEVRSKSTATQ